MKATSTYSRVLIGLLSLVIMAGGAVSVVAARAVKTVRPNTYVGGVLVGSMTTEEAAKALRIWWEAQKRVPLEVSWPGHDLKLAPMKPGQLDTRLDDEATVAQLPLDTMWDSLENRVAHRADARMDFDPKYTSAGASMTALKARIKALVKPAPAKFSYVAGVVYTKPEISGYVLDSARLPDAVGKAISAGGPVEIPVVMEEKHVADATLAQITDLVSTYTTFFPARQFSRNNNIRVAASKLNGVVLLPGEELSFNTTVGKRTITGGFMEAGVYKNGKHDKGVGGGICQVSSTLYNASLIGNLAIVRRTNHSMPVSYVPLGRDATVDYGSIDLVLKNSYATPIAITSLYRAGNLTFRIFGKRDPELSVRIEREGQKDWDQVTEFVPDRTLPAGATKIVEKGSRGHRIRTYRLVYHGRELVRREALGTSYYRPSKKIVARGVGAGLMPPSASSQGNTVQTSNRNR